MSVQQGNQGASKGPLFGDLDDLGGNGGQLSDKHYVSLGSFSPDGTHPVRAGGAPEQVAMLFEKTPPES